MLIFNVHLACSSYLFINIHYKKTTFEYSITINLKQKTTATTNSV